MATTDQEGASEADFLLFFMSRVSLESKWVENEYRLAFESQSRAGGTRVIPILLEMVTLPPFLQLIQCVDFTHSYSEGMKQLLRALQAAEGPKPKDVVAVDDLAKAVASEVAKLLGLESFPRSQATQEVSASDVFVIISFQDDMEPIFEGIQEAGRSLGLNVQRVKDVPGDYRINDQIIKMIQSAKFVVADLTHERPNVYFELGYVRGLGKTVVTIARQGTTIHFDVSEWACLFYTDSRILERDLKKRFEYEMSRLG